MAHKPKQRLTTYFIDSHLESVRRLATQAAVPFSTVIAEALDGWLYPITGQRHVQAHPEAFWREAYGREKTKK